MVVKDGRFGPYVTDGETNASLRKGDTVESITIERAAELPGRAPPQGSADEEGARPRRSRPAKKKPAAKKTARRRPRSAGRGRTGRATPAPSAAADAVARATEPSPA